MQIWIDTADITAVQLAQTHSVLAGITTNPSILVQANQPIKDLLRKLLALKTESLAVQVTAENTAEMIRQAKQLRSLSERIVIKVPATPNGYAAMAAMSAANIPVMATAIYTAQQFLMVANLQVAYAAPYLRHIAMQNGDYLPELKTMLDIVRAQQYTTKIIAAAIPDLATVLKCAALGVPAITITPNTFAELMAVHPSTQKSLESFAKDWGGRNSELYDFVNV